MKSKQRERASARWMHKIKAEAKCSDTIQHFEALRPRLVILYARVSSPGQEDHLRAQETDLIAAAEKGGARVIEMISRVEQGWEEGRTGLFRAVALSKKTGAPIVARSTHRFARRSPPNHMKPLRIIDMEKLREETEGVELATLYHPDKPEAEVRSEESKSGQAASGDRGGRRKIDSRMKARRERLAPTAYKLWDDGRGLSYRQIGRKLRVPWRTVADWIRREKTTRALQEG